MCKTIFTPKKYHLAHLYLAVNMTNVALKLQYTISGNQASARIRLKSDPLHFSHIFLSALLCSARPSTYILVMFAVLADAGIARLLACESAIVTSSSS